MRNKDIIEFAPIHEGTILPDLFQNEIIDGEEVNRLNYKRLYKRSKEIGQEKLLIDMAIANYVLIDKGDGRRCAWCNKKADKIKNLDQHLMNHEKQEKNG